MDITVIATAMPTIVSELGGLESYSWVFAIYMLTSTTAGLIFGKLSDIYGRRPVYMVAVALFIAGSLLCGVSMSMPMLIGARALQGLGAGGLMPMAFIIVGDIFTFLTPMLLGWVLTSIVASRLMLRFSYRSLAIAGMSGFVLGTFMLSRVRPEMSQLELLVALALMGFGIAPDAVPLADLIGGAEDAAAAAH